MKRVAIVLTKDLDRGQAGNVSAILMGQVGLFEPELYGSYPIYDRDGNRHAAIRFSTVILEARNTGQLLTFVQKLTDDGLKIPYFVFSQTGQSLHNAYEQYRDMVEARQAKDLTPVGVALVGEDEDVRAATKRFSLMR